MSPMQSDDDTLHLKRASDNVRQLSATRWRQDPLGKADASLVIRLSWHSAAMWEEARSAFPGLDALEDEPLWSAIVAGVVDAGEDAAAVEAAWDRPEAGSNLSRKPDHAMISERRSQDTRRLKEAMESVRVRSATRWRQDPEGRANRPLIMRLAWHSAAMYKDVRSAFPDVAMLDHEQVWSIVLMGVLDTGEDRGAVEAVLEKKLS